AAVEAGEVAAAEGDPDNAVAVDIHAAGRVAGDGSLRVIPRDFVIFGERGFGRILARIEADQAAGEAEDAAPDHAVGAEAESIEGGVEARVPGGIDLRIDDSGGAEAFAAGGRGDLLFTLGVVVALAVAVGVEHESGPALGLR